MDQLQTLLETVKADYPLILSFGTRALSSFAILIIGIWIARILRKRIQGTGFGIGKIDQTVRPVIASALFYTIIGITVYAALRRLGIEATGLLAVFGAAGLAIGLALKDTLGNIAAGAMLLILRPLAVGEFIETPNVSGTVQEVGLFATTIKNLEGLYVFVPNGQIWNNRIQNFNRHTERRLIMNLGLAYDTDLEAAKALLIETMSAHHAALKLPEGPVVLVTEFGESSINFSARVWLPAADFLPNASMMRVSIKSALDKAGIEIPFPQRVIMTKNTSS